jgi:YHS domain-containing protein
MTAKARQIIVLSACVGLFLAATPSDKHAALAQNASLSQLLNLPMTGERMQTHEIAGIALHGFDPVSYKLGPVPQAGRAEHELARDGVAWRFASESNRQAFMNDPGSYIPEFDGYDATAIGLGRAVEGDPLIFAHINGRIFFFRSHETRETFLSSTAALQAAEKNWSAVQTQLAR